MVEHAMVTFPNGSTDAVLVAMTLKDGKVFRTETGSTPLTESKGKLVGHRAGVHSFEKN